MQKSTIITLLVLGVIVAVLALLAYRSMQQQLVDADSPAAVSLATPDVTYTALDGTPLNLQDYDDTVRVVNSWATWCPFCVTELPDFSTVATEYQSQGVVVMAINRGESSSKVEAFLTTIAGTENILFVQDEADHFYDSIGGFSMPETIFYDADGNIVVHKRGFMTVAEMRQHIEAALAATNS